MMMKNIKVYSINNREENILLQHLNQCDISLCMMQLALTRFENLSTNFNYMPN